MHKNYGLSRICSKWPPRGWRQTSNRCAKLSIPRMHSSQGISLIFAAIAAFSSPIVWRLFWYTWSFRYRHSWIRCPLDVTLPADQPFLKLLSQPVKCVIWCVWGGSPHLAGTTGHLDQSLCDVRVMPRTSSALPHNVPYSPFETSHVRLQTNTNRLCHVWKWLPMLSNLLRVTISVRLPTGVLYPSKHSFCYWPVLKAENAPRQTTKHGPKSLDCLRLCHKTIRALQHVLPYHPLWAFALFGSGKDTNEDLISRDPQFLTTPSKRFLWTLFDWLPYFIDVSFCPSTHPPTGMSVHDAFRIKILHSTMLSTLLNPVKNSAF